MEQQPLNELRSHPCVEVGAAVRAAQTQILARWRELVKRTLPQFDLLTRKQLENSLPEVLERMARALIADASAATERLIDESPIHGATRYHQEFSLNQLLIEYNILRGVVIHETSRVLGRPLNVEENVQLNQAMDLTSRQAAVAFAEHQSRAMKSETAAMTKFLSFLSHDLRGGLNGAVLMIEVLRRQLAAEAKFAGAVEDLEMVRRSILETVATMERFLNAEKLRLGRMPVKPGPIQVRELTAELQKSFNYQIAEQEMSMGVLVEPATLSINSDRQLLVLVLQNLISNAIKYGRRGTVKLSVEQSGSLPEGVVCRFSVKDQGPGIAPEKLAELFDSYSRGETYGQKGIGLGLYIAGQAAALLNARLWAESTPGQGSTFHLDLTQA